MKHLAILALLMTLSFATAPAVASPTIAWRVEIDGMVNVPPALGPDGEIAVQAFELVVIEPDGTIRWRQDLPVPSSRRMCAIGPDGRIYASTTNDLRAFAPDGSLLWTALSNSNAFRPYAGPSVGPDGNIYVLDITNASIGGHGFVSLTPDGDVRWSYEHPYWGLANMGEQRRAIAFAAGKAFVSSSGLPCEGSCLASGVMAFTLDGDVAWITTMNTPHWITPSATGKLFVARDPLSFDILDTEDGSVTPVLLSPHPTVTAKRVGVGPDGSGFAGMTPTNAAIRRLDPSGSSTVFASGIGIPGGPVVSPDGSLIVVATAESVLPSLNNLTGLDAQTGEVLWTVPLLPDADGSFPIAMGYPTFAADGSAVYLPAASMEASWIYGFDLHRTVDVTDPRTAGLDALSLRFFTGAGGRGFAFNLPAAAPVSLKVHDLRGREVATIIERESMDAGETIRPWNPRRLASGVYLARLQVGNRSAVAKLVHVR